MKYAYYVSFAIAGRDGCHVSAPFGDAPAAINAAQCTYAALQAALTSERDTPPSFKEIRTPACVKFQCEPRLRQFAVCIQKAPR